MWYVGMAYYITMIMTVVIGVFSMGMTLACLGLTMSRVAHYTIIT